MRRTDRSGAADATGLVGRVRDYVLDNRVLIAWAVAACLWAWHGRVHEIDPVHQRHDLDILMTKARASVDQYVREQKTLPQEIPDQSLTSFVKYTAMNPDANPPTYSLEGKLLDVSDYWSNAGSGGGK